MSPKNVTLFLMIGAILSNQYPGPWLMQHKKRLFCGTSIIFRSTTLLRPCCMVRGNTLTPYCTLEGDTFQFFFYMNWVILSTIYFSPSKDFFLSHHPPKPAPPVRTTLKLSIWRGMYWLHKTSPICFYYIARKIEHVLG